MSSESPVNPGRRDFLKGVGGVVAAVSAAERLNAKTHGGTVGVADVPNAGPAYSQATDSSLLLGNQQVELKIDRATGFFQDIFNKQTGIHHKLEGTGVWPFGMRLGDAREPDLLRVEISAKALHPQVMQHEEGRNDADPTGGHGKTLVLKYENMVATGGTATGIKLTVSVALQDEADYFLIKARVENGSRYGITNFYSGTGELVADSTREKETLVAPGWSYGTVWQNPHDYFVERETFGYPIFGSQACLVSGWLDLQGEKGGIGVGYLNRQGLSMYFNVQRAGKGLKVNWQLFNLMHEKAVESWTNVGGVYPLQPGEKFETDTWILAPHAGDWHRMADIYRKEYEETFKGDYLSWEDTHEAAKKLDLSSGYTILDIRDQFPGEPVHNKFSDVLPRVKTFVEASGVRPENLQVSITGHSIHWCLYMPDFIPCCPEGGGDEACKQMVSDLRAMGIEGILFYAHLFYDHPKANDYVPEADTGYDHQNVLWKEIGNVGCMDCDAWVKLWRTKYIPGYEDLGASGPFLDQGPTQYLVCTKAGHRHRTDAVDVLGAHVRGVLNLVKEWRAGSKKRKPYFWTEAGSDVQTRTVDIWSCPHTAQYARGGISKHEIVRYTFPYRLCVDDPASSPTDLNDSLVNGFIAGGWMEEAQRLEKALKDEAMAFTLRQYVKIRRALREEKAPGYPYGFRDTIGLQVGDPRLIARAYRDARGITVVYYSNDAVSGVVRVDKAVLGFPGRGAESFRVSLKKNEAGYKILLT